MSADFEKRDLSGFAAEQQAYFNSYIQFADGKALAVFAWSSAALGFLVSDEAFVAALRLGPFSIEGIVAGMPSVLLAVSAALAVFVIAPRLWSSERGLIFWGAVARHASPRDYVDNVLAASDVSLAETRLANTYHLAKVCARKYQRLRAAIWTTAAGFVFAVLWFLAYG